MAAPETKPCISATQGMMITTEAATWKDTPYALVGNGSMKGKNGSGDCSGTTCKIYSVAGFTYDYQSTATFPQYALDSGLFCKLGPGEAMQDGDILYWSDHMAIYSTFTSIAESQYKTTPRTNKQGQPWTQYNDMWTASRPGGLPYRPSAIKYSGKMAAPLVYRWLASK
jgi:hypothetical protein